MKRFDLALLDQSAVRQMSATSLAFIGDGVFDLYIRSRLLTAAPRSSSHQLNNEKVACVNAAAQARAAHAIMADLTEDELAVLKRGRNAKSLTVPRNAKLADYKYATGFEALLGYLYLQGEEVRLRQLMSTAFSLCRGETNEN